MSDRAYAQMAQRHLDDWGGRPHGRMKRFRDRVAESVCNWLLINVASWDYQKSIYYLIQAGREAVLVERKSEVSDA